jgi:hypothetical protein
MVQRFLIAIILSLCIIRLFVLTTQSQNSLETCHNIAVCLYSQPNYKLHPTAVHSLHQSVFTTQLQTSPHSCHTHSASACSCIETISDMLTNRSICTSYTEKMNITEYQEMF